MRAASNCWRLCPYGICASCELYFCLKHENGKHILNYSRGAVMNLRVFLKQKNICAHCAGNPWRKLEQYLRSLWHCFLCYSKKQLLWDGCQRLICRHCLIKHERKQEQMEIYLTQDSNAMEEI